MYANMRITIKLSQVFYDISFLLSSHPHSSRSSNCVKRMKGTENMNTTTHPTLANSKLQVGNMGIWEKGEFIKSTSKWGKEQSRSLSVIIMRSQRDLDPDSSMTHAINFRL